MCISKSSILLWDDMIVQISCLIWQKSSSTSRLAVVHNPAHISDSHFDHPIARAVQVALDTLPVGMAKSFITKLVKEENVAALASGEKTMDDLAVNVSVTCF